MIQITCGGADGRGVGRSDCKQNASEGNECCGFHGIGLGFDGSRKELAGRAGASKGDCTLPVPHEWVRLKGFSSFFQGRKFAAPRCGKGTALETRRIAPETSVLRRFEPNGRTITFRHLSE
jgi:hypothetical protein